MDNSHIKSFLLDLFFPKFCLGCSQEGFYLCPDCRSLLEIMERNYPVSSQNLSGLYFALSYKDNPLAKKLIHQFKYEPYLKDLAKNLAGLLVEHFILTKNNTDEFWQNSVLVPVPLEKKKLKTRGYNQAEELAKELAKAVKIPVISNNLIKTKATKPQVGLPKEERERNLKNAFAIKNCSTSDVEQFFGKKVFLVDDVYTTGSTMEECARVLKKAGAQSVWGIALARES